MIAVEQAVRPPTSTPPAVHKGGAERKISLAAVLVYGGGMLAAMLSGMVATGDWFNALIFIPHALLAVACGAGAMAMALMAPDPYVSEHGEPPAKLPDFN